MKKMLVKTENILWGDCSGITGDCSGLRGDLDKCEISDEDRKNGISINDLVKS